jgi:prephenate dehydrogenase
MGLADRFVGAHPLAGDHRSGWDASRAGLFAGARVFLCPADGAGEEAVALAEALWTGLGGTTERMDATEHDRRLAWTSHLPQAVSTALAMALAGRGIGRGELGPGGRDVTRLAGSSPEMWAGVLRDNADAVGDALAAMEAEVRALREAVASGDADRIRERLARARRWAGD